MATETSSIDDLLSASMSQHSQPVTESHQNEEPTTDYESLDESVTEIKEPESMANVEDQEGSSYEDNNEESTPEKQYDDYGNEKPTPRTYTEDEVNERVNKAIRERLARGKNQNAQQPTQQQMQQQASGFEYNAESEEGWQQQLEQFVEQTFNKISQKQLQQQQMQREQEAEQVFVEKFTSGMDKFSDFKQVVGSQPITDPMTMALRGINDPASFIYAASKRHPEELQRISKLQDPYSQILEIGRLEERMRKTSQGTNAPRPIGRTKEDSPIKFKEKDKEPSIEDLIAKSEAKRMAKIKQFRGK